MKSDTAAPYAPKLILAPCDFSSCSPIALNHATSLASQYEATLVLLHVIEPVQPGFLSEGTISRQAQGLLRERALHQLGEFAKIHAVGPKLGRMLVKSGRPWEVIVAVAEKIGCDLIVMGTHGYSGLKHAVIGSVAERVVRFAPCPVLTVRAGTLK